MPHPVAIARFSIAAAVVACAASFAVSRPTQDEPASDKKGADLPTKVADLGWMTGAWTGKTGGWTEEVWSKPVGGAMHGMCRIGQDAQHVMYEILVIEEDADGIALRIRHFGPKLAAREDKAIEFRLTASGENQVTWEAKEKGGVTRLIYRLESQDTMVARLEKPRGGKTMGTDFRYTRAK